MEPGVRVRRFKPWMIPAGLAVLFFIGYLVAGLVVKVKSSSLNAEIKAARDEGVAVEVVDLTRRPPVPSDENAAPVYRDAFILFQTESHESRLKYQLDARTKFDFNDAQDRESLTGILAIYKPALEEFAEGSKRPHCDFAYDWKRLNRLAMPELTQIRDTTDLFLDRAEMEDRGGKRQEAIDDVRVTLRIADHLSETPDMLAALVCTGIQGRAAREIELMLGRNGLKPGYVELVQPLLELIRSPDIRNCYQAGFVTGVQTILTEANFSPVNFGPLPKNLKVALFIPSMRQLLALRLVQFNRKLYEATPPNAVPNPGLISKTREIDHNLEIQTGLDYSWAQFVSFSKASFIEGLGRVVARRRLLAEEMEALKAKRATGHWPAQLPPLGGDSLDPFTGKELHYRVQGDRVVIYSVGPSLQDHKGAETTDRQTSDIVVSYPPHNVPGEGKRPMIRSLPPPTGHVFSPMSMPLRKPGAVSTMRMGHPAD